MAGFTVTVTDNASPMLRAAMSRMRDFHQPLRLAGAYMFKATIRQFQSEGARSGQPWKPLAKSTLKRRKKGSAAILQDTGRLRRSITSRAQGSIYNLSRYELVMGTNVEYGAIHQFGGDISRTSQPGVALHRRVVRGKGKGGWRFAKATKSTTLGPNRRMVFWKGGKSYTITIPARPFLVVTDGDKKEIRDIFFRWAIGAFKRK